MKLLKSCLIGLGLHPEQVARRFASINNAAPAFSEATRLFAGEGDKQP